MSDQDAIIASIIDQLGSAAVHPIDDFDRGIRYALSTMLRAFGSDPVPNDPVHARIAAAPR